MGGWMGGRSTRGGNVAAVGRSTLSCRCPSRCPSDVIPLFYTCRFRKFLPFFNWALVLGIGTPRFGDGLVRTFGIGVR